MRSRHWIITTVFIMTASAPAFADTLISGVACYPRTGGDESGGEWVLVPNLTIYCATGKHHPGRGTGGFVAVCNAIWGKDETSAEGRRVAGGQFHFHNPDPIKIGISVMYRLDDPHLPVMGDSKSGRYYSEYFETDKTGSGSLKVRFVLHQTNRPFKSVKEAAAQIARAVTARYFLGRGGKEGKQMERIKEDIATEVGTILDSLHINEETARVNARERQKEVRDYLEKFEIQAPTDERPIRLLELLPDGDGFWLERNGRAEGEKRYWETLLEGKQPGNR